ncbi:TIGR04282 family arsenosugar biosynthesis glycosyltransferase [Gemella sp. GH3]|uniref:TIGR04282 family arsenosugar biosynthesis glycosyltransferase n=1 Tax=unclassified Gemella TaxID=2624949 RepID=UPI0015CFB263|nr:MULTISPECIES: TIGR04282 family arsenosugar biosynthesis glycosyltransferase [unclassified Gemella]MBF0713666.1 TIGR04282 family arsenosugar biosynthesis glycosyltransferase [Gemella sp. GH3.1]NYS50618.1 TIGR04282 family arsenosugar biosynthesis glycosyltransferase [Gemella sp. GH3]
MTEIVILFTRVPKEGSTKTRLYDFLTPKDAVEIQKKMLKNIFSNLIKWNFKVVVYHDGNKEDDKYMSDLLSVQEDIFFYQRGKTLGEKMYNAFNDVQKLYPNKKTILIGSDIVNISKEMIETAFNKLNNNEAVINPTFDGGYYLIGLRKLKEEIFSLSEYGTETVFSKTINSFEKNNITYYVGEKCLDIDTKEDLLAYETGFKNVALLGAGEYNINFLYDYDIVEKRVLRLNMKSQMNLDNQMAYEYHTLKLLEDSGVTPKVYSLEESPKLIPYKYLTMEYLQGRPLDYNKDMKIASYLLSKIHNHKYSLKNELILAKNPFKLMYEECENMANHYLLWEQGDLKVKTYLKRFLEVCKDKLKDNYILGNQCIINTELNSGNFIIGKAKEDSYVIDWEKSLIGECEQDIAHFLAPTTTFWKTDKILSLTEIDDFLEDYSNYRHFSREKFEQYFIFTCLRGITWCSMAYKEYTLREKILTDDYTFNKIRSYLDYKFLEMLESYFI